VHDDLACAGDAGCARTLKELEELVRIPSVSAPDFDGAEVQRSAEAVADLLRDSGVSRVRPLEIEGAHPAVCGVVEGPAGTPTVLLYAHHDVQPPSPAEEWDSAPFEATERDSRLSGCGQRTTRPGWSSTPQRFVHSTVRSLWA